MKSNIIKLPFGGDEPLRISEYSLGIYHVRRAVDADTGWGFLTIRDNEGRPIIVRDVRGPDEYVHDVIEGWCEGHRSENRRARRTAQRMLRELVRDHGRGEIE